MECSWDITNTPVRWQWGALGAMGWGGITFLNAPWAKAGLQLVVWLLGSGSPHGLSYCFQGLWLLDPDRGSCSAWHRHHFTASHPAGCEQTAPLPPAGHRQPPAGGTPCPVFLHHLSACAEPVNHAVGGRERGWGLVAFLGLGTFRAAPRARGPPGAGDMQGHTRGWGLAGLSKRAGILLGMRMGRGLHCVCTGSSHHSSVPMRDPNLLL